MKIFITDGVHKICASILENANFELVQKPTLSKEELIEEIKNYDGIIVRSATKLDKEVLESSKNLKIIGRAGAGLDNIDLNKAAELGIKVVNSPEPLSIAVAEFTIGVMISLMRHISKGDNACHSGDWNKQDCIGNTLYGKKLGIVGFGRIGKEVASRALSFKMTVGVFDILETEIKQAKSMGLKIFESIENLIKESDIVSLHVPYTEKNYQLIDKSKLDFFDENKILINTARGKLIDEPALIQKLKNREIKGAALDVFYEEPLMNSELSELNNVILTPHIASQAKETQIEGAKIIANKFMEFFNKK